MGLFSKKEQEIKKPVPVTLPRLPELPEFPNFDEYPTSRDSIPQLPSFPNNPLGEKFSQDTIKQAVTGKKEGEGDFEADDYEDDEMHMMPEPPIEKMPEDFSPGKKEIAYKFKGKTFETEPLFIRIDKFEESMKTFEKAKEKISEIGHMLNEIKKIKEEEEQQLSSWEREMQTVKEQIEKIDRELFSKL